VDLELSRKATGQEVDAMKHVVIVGGGFAGLSCARKLAGSLDVRVTLIDKNNYQQFQPLLYQVASAMLSPSNAAFSLRGVLRGHPNADVKMAEVISADLKTRTVKTSDGKSYEGDFLVLACGSQVNFFGTPGADKYAYPLYSLRDAELLRSRLLMLLESADRNPSLIDQGALTIVVVGAGPTGTETAGALGDLKRMVLAEVYRDLDVSKIRIILVDTAGSVLKAFSEKSRAYATRTLQQRGVELLLGVGVKEVRHDHVLLSNGNKILTRTTIWAGGLKAASLSGAMGIQTGDGGRIEVQPDFSVKGFEGVFALGDFANIGGVDGESLPQLASVAQQAGTYCAGAIMAKISGRSPKPFRYFDKGIMAMVGRNAAVAEVGQGRHELTGPVAFLAWLAVHAVLLDTTLAKIEAIIEWAREYFHLEYSSPILDQPEQAALNLTESES
jgi:NADH dehydrogenase